jgi:hypothetical protein
MGSRYLRMDTPSLGVNNRTSHANSMAFAQYNRTSRVCRLLSTANCPDSVGGRYRTSETPSPRNLWINPTERVIAFGKTTASAIVCSLTGRHFAADIRRSIDRKLSTPLGRQ